MIMGPFAAWVIKSWTSIWDDRIKPGFEMLVNNFSAGIAAAGLAVVGFFAFGPVIAALSTAFGNGVNWLIEHSLLPLASIIIEPAKVLFLNNAINQGVLTPLGIQQRSSRASRSCSCWRPTPARASACCWPTRSSAPAWRRAPHRPRRSSSSSAGSTRSTSRTC